MPADETKARLQAIEEKIDAAAEAAHTAANGATSWRETEDLKAAMRIAAEVARVAAEATAESKRVAAHLANHDETLVRLEHAITKVNGSVHNLLESVMVLQRNSMRVLGAGALLCGVLIFVLARALGF